MIDTNAQVVILDLVIVLESWSIALWFTFDLKRMLFLTMALGFALVGLSALVLLPGDISLMLGLQPGSDWFLTREFRALPNRYIWATGFGFVAIVLRFGKWVK